MCLCSSDESVGGSRTDPIFCNVRLLCINEKLNGYDMFRVPLGFRCTRQRWFHLVLFRSSRDVVDLSGWEGEHIKEKIPMMYLFRSSSHREYFYTSLKICFYLFDKTRQVRQPLVLSELCERRNLRQQGLILSNKTRRFRPLTSKKLFKQRSDKNCQFLGCPDLKMSPFPTLCYPMCPYWFNSAFNCDFIATYHAILEFLK